MRPELNMPGRLDEIAAKRARLVEQAAAQREALSRQVQPLRVSLAVADQGVALLRTAGRHPLLLAAAAALLVVWRPRRALRWLEYGWMGWQLLRKLRGRVAPGNRTP